jgi:hypothetical protein
MSNGAQKTSGTPSPYSVQSPAQMQLQGGDLTSMFSSIMQQQNLAGPQPTVPGQVNNKPDNRPDIIGQIMQQIQSSQNGFQQQAPQLPPVQPMNQGIGSLNMNRNPNVRSQ